MRRSVLNKILDKGEIKGLNSINFARAALEKDEQVGKQPKVPSLHKDGLSSRTSFLPRQETLAQAVYSLSNQRMWVRKARQV